MDKFRYTKEWEDKCRQNIWWKKSCCRCLFEALCLFQQNQEKIWKVTHEVNETLEKNL